MNSTFSRGIDQYNVASEQSASGPRFRHKGQFMHSISTTYFQCNLLILSMHYNFTDLFQILEIGDVHWSEFDNFVIDLNASGFGGWSRADKIHFHNGHVSWRFPFSGRRDWLRLDGTDVHLRPSRTETKEMAWHQWWLTIDRNSSIAWHLHFRWRLMVNLCLGMHFT